MTFLFLPKREQQIAPPLDIDALQKALGSVALHRAALNNAEKLHRDLPRQSLTPTPPPPDREAIIAESREIENKARKHLSEDGCPPCYPADLSVPLQDIPDEYEEIISYWRFHPDTGHMAELHAQYKDWKSFRLYQEKIRRYHLPRQTFHVYLEKARDRFRRHGLEEYSCLQADRQQQNGLEDWIEFQNYHLTIYESIEKDIRDERENLDGARKQSKDTGASGIRGAKNIEIFEYRLGYEERRLRQHENLLRWIEQQRIAMVARQAPSVHNNGSHDDDQGQTRKAETRAVRTSFVPNHRKDQNARSALSPVRSGVSKKMPQKRTLQLQKRDVTSTAENTIMTLSTLQEKKPHRARKNTPRSQRVSKTAKNAHAPKGNPASVDVKSRPMSRSKRQKPIKQPASVIIKCSGRVSRRPERFCPG